MANRNSGLIKANKAEKDEFYTTLPVIEEELQHYRAQFKGKTVLCNCDDPFESNFFRYFCLNFNRMGLKKLIATSYAGSPVQGDLFNPDSTIGKHTPYEAVVTTVHDANGDGFTDMDDVKTLFQNHQNSLERLKGNGDYKSPECLKLMDEADIVCTNPPFSKWRDFLATLVAHKKKFLIIGNMNAVTYKEVFPLIKNNQIWFGASIHSGDRKFYVPDSYPLNAAGCGIDENGRRYVRVKGVRWYTNLDLKERHENLILTKKYSPSLYPHYVNYDAIEVNKTANIPFDYAGVMGVPITFLDKYNPDQFDILGTSNSLARPIDQLVEPDAKYTKGGPRFYLKVGKKTYRRIYDRIIIKNKHPESQK